MGEVADFLYKLTPLILGFAALLIAPAADRLKLRRQPPGAPSAEVQVIQGQPVDLTGDRVRALENDILQERELARLRELLIRNNIDYKEAPDGQQGNAGTGGGNAG